MFKLRLSETPQSGPNWLVANKAFSAEWKRPGGDYRDRDGVLHGSNPWASGTINYANPLPLCRVDVTDLVRHWKDTGDDSMYFTRTAGGALSFASDETATPPRIVVGSITCPCHTAAWISSSSNQTIDTGTLQYVSLLRFDLSALPEDFTGQAFFEFQPITVYAPGTTTFAIFSLEMPTYCSDPAKDIGVFKEAEATEGDVITFDDLVSEDHIFKNYAVVTPISTGGIEFLPNVEKGFTWARCWGNEAGSRAVAWHKWAQPKSAIPLTAGQEWRRDYKAGEALGYDEVHLQFMINIGKDLFPVFNELGMKLPGLAGTYNWSTSGARTEPPPPSDGTWEARLWFSGPSDEHPNLYRGAIYWYGPDHTVGGNYGIGKVKFFNKVNFLFEAEKLDGYRVEQRIKCNSFDTNGNPVADGIQQIFIDKVLVHEELELIVRKYPHAQIQDLPFFNLYHGGKKFPLGLYHVDFGRVITATKYVGSLKDLPVNPPDPENPVATFKSIIVSPEHPLQGSEYTITWDTDNAVAVAIDGVEMPPDGTITKIAGADTTVIFEAFGAGEIREVPIDIIETPPPDQLPEWAPGSRQAVIVSLNTPPDSPSPGTMAHFNCWGGGAFIRSYGKYGAVAFHAGGQHGGGWNMNQGVVLFDFETRLFSLLCKSDILHKQALASPNDPYPTDDYGMYLDNATTQTPHTYNGLAEWPAEWGRFPKGALVRAGNNALGSTSRLTSSLSHVFAFDLSKEIGGHHRISDAIQWRSDQLNYSTYIGCCTDMKRQGWWMQAMGSGQPMSRVVFSDTVGNLSFLSQRHERLYEGIFHHFWEQGEQDVLMRIAPTYTGTSGIDIFDLSQANPPPINIKPTGTPPDPQYGIMGIKWSTLRKRFVGIVRATGFVAAELIPSNPDNILGSTWSWNTWIPPQPAGIVLNGLLDLSAINGHHGRLIEIPKLKSFSWIAGHNLATAKTVLINADF